MLCKLLLLLLRRQTPWRDLGRDTQDFFQFLLLPGSSVLEPNLNPGLRDAELLGHGVSFPVRWIRILLKEALHHGDLFLLVIGSTASGQLITGDGSAAETGVVSTVSGVVADARRTSALVEEPRRGWRGDQRDGPSDHRRGFGGIVSGNDAGKLSHPDVSGGNTALNRHHRIRTALTPIFDMELWQNFAAWWRQLTWQLLLLPLIRWWR